MTQDNLLEELDDNEAEATAGCVTYRLLRSVREQLSDPPDRIPFR